MKGATRLGSTPLYQNLYYYLLVYWKMKLAVFGDDFGLAVMLNADARVKLTVPVLLLTSMKELVKAGNATTSIRLITSEAMACS